MDSTSLPSIQAPMTATIDIPYPAPWTDLEGDANTNDYGWRQPRYNVTFSKRSFDDDFAGILVKSKPSLPLGAHLAYSPIVVAELERFADSRQTKFEGKPLKDGSNLFTRTYNHVTNHLEPNGSQGLREMYAHMKEVLTMLYQRCLVLVEDDLGTTNAGQQRRYTTYGWDRLENTLQFGALHMYQREIAKLERPLNGPEFAPGFEWIPAFRTSIADGLESVQAALWWSVEHAYDPIPHMQMAIDMVPSICRLILFLLTRDLSFNNSLAIEHVEDLLHDKRINWFTDQDMFTMGPEETLDLVSRFDAELKPTLTKWQQEIRKCFDYRMLREWGYGRHWKKMYLVCDEPVGSEERGAIEMFKKWATNNSKLTYDMFSIHPMYKGEIAEGDICTICYSDWEGTELVMDLKCGHRFHPNCIFQHWDNPNHYSNPCANCRASNGWLKDRMDFAALKVDVDYTVDQGAAATSDQNFEYGIERCLEENWPGGVRGNFRPGDGHHEYYWRSWITHMRTKHRKARYRADPVLGDIDNFAG